MKDANYAPVYCAMYPKLAEIARSHGYALAIHGSMGRDFDLCCIPWTDEAADPEVVIDAFCTEYAIRCTNKNQPEQKKHGRIAYTITVAWGECAIDLSFMPRQVS